MRTDDTNFSLTTTGENNEEKIYVHLTNNGEQRNIYSPLRLGIGLRTSDKTAGDPLNSSLHLISPSEKATLISTGGNLQTLIDRGIGNTTLTAGDVTIGFNNSDVLTQLDSKFHNKLDRASVMFNTDGVQHDDGDYEGKLTFSLTIVGSDEP